MRLVAQPCDPTGWTGPESLDFHGPVDTFVVYVHGTNSRMKNTRLLIIFLIVFIDLLGFGIVIPILPSYAQGVFHASDFTVGMLVASFSFMQLVFTPFWGRLSDRIGRKPVLMIGLANTVIGYVLFGFAHTLPMLFFSRMLAGLGGANISAAQAYIADVTPVHERAKGMGLIGAAFGLGFVFGPVIGGLLSTYGYAVPGFAAAGLSTIALILTYTVLPEPERDSSIARVSTAFSLRGFTDTLRKPRIGLLLILFFLVTFAYANIYATFPILARSDFHYGDHEIGFLFGFIGIVGALTQGGLIRLFSGKVSERTLFLAGSAMTMIGLVCIPLSGNTWILHGVLTVLAFGSGLVTPQVLGMISQQAGPAEQGSILGINQSLGALARGLGPLWGGFIFQTAGHPYPFFTGGAVMLVVLLISWRSL